MEFEKRFSASRKKLTITLACCSEDRVLVLGGSYLTLPLLSTAFDFKPAKLESVPDLSWSMLAFIATPMPSASGKPAAFNLACISEAFFGSMTMSAIVPSAFNTGKLMVTGAANTKPKVLAADCFTDVVLVVIARIACIPHCKCVQLAPVMEFLKIPVVLALTNCANFCTMAICLPKAVGSAEEPFISTKGLVERSTPKLL